MRVTQMRCRLVGEVLAPTPGEPSPPVPPGALGRLSDINTELADTLESLHQTLDEVSQLV